MNSLRPVVRAAVEVAVQVCSSARQAPSSARLDSSDIKENEMATGTVKWFNETKGFGFIAQDGGDGDVFVHHTGIAGTGFKNLVEDQKVEFDVTRGPKGLQAENVRSA
jgi:CspA family cold shock protein